MLVGDLEQPVLKQTARPKLQQTDIFCPSGANPSSGKVDHAHRGREPGTDYAEKKFKYKLYRKSIIGKSLITENSQIKQQLVNLKYTALAEKKRYQLHIKKRLNCKLEQLEKEIDMRRYRLRELLAAEDHIFITETLHKAQEGDSMKFERIRNDVKAYMEQREMERQNYIHEKRIIQYANRCAELRPIIVKKNLLESKTVQQQQIRENEARREAENEIDKLWDDLRKRQDEALLEREKQDALFRHNNMLKSKEILMLQIEGKKLQKLEEKEINKANLLEIIKDGERKKREENEANISIKQKKKENGKIMVDQIMEQKRFMVRRKLEEQALEQAFSRLSQLEIEKEQSKASDTKMQAKNEEAMYKQYLLDLKNQRIQEDLKTSTLLASYQEEVRNQKEATICAEKAHKKKMIQECGKALAEQIKNKKIEAEKNLKSKKLENELIQKCLDTNIRLEQESAKLNLLAIAQYRHDLQKQIEYNKLLKERERIDLERQLKIGMKEEETYQNIVFALIDSENEGHGGAKKHPFRKTLESYDCHCSKK